ncbi:hypothetical protein DGG96_02160 [Legionella qingyii]|uniref:Uncharacterized protein n=1 Tax=Legionella qingyii TaxID=2184757 RepID=A0A317U515_9GAMM|nr:hypothetical protein [Legionella qingyii]PWY56509.1 hypothetical protein DGG96_07030 [Legionella qingyii]PWY57134.1 hypothetical protein DGG96_02160 [Legionella qingyii]RUR25026.1 hypothetical protein ELY20_04515 [Legionella qingyii]RUR28702.1 hypothetical protein ELY16_01465 [Legionella qingyii]
MSREKINQDIAKFLNKKMQETWNFKGKWTANADGVAYKIAKEDYDKDNIHHNVLFGEKLSKTQESPPAYEAVYTKPSELIEFLKKIEEQEMAEKYQQAIEEENKNIASKLIQLMKNDNVQWDSDVDGVFSTTTLDIDTSGYKYAEAPLLNRAKQDHAQRSHNDIFLKVPVKPKITSIKEKDGQTNQVEIKASYSNGTDLEKLHSKIDTALKSKVTRTNTSQVKADLAAIKSQDPRMKEMHSELLEKIRQFCEPYSNVDGLKKMKDIATYSDSPMQSLIEVIQLADWKKSDSDFTKGWHNKMRGRAPEVEEFYQNLAKLELNNPESVKEFINSLNKDKTQDNAPNNNFG